MALGGKREGAGRKKGAVNKKTKEVQEKAKEYGITPLEFMLQTLNNSSHPHDVRAAAARDAAPYVHSKMPTALNVNANITMHEQALSDLE